MATRRGSRCGPGACGGVMNGKATTPGGMKKGRLSLPSSPATRRLSRRVSPSRCPSPRIFRALRIFRIFRILRIIRAFRLLRILRLLPAFRPIGWPCWRGCAISSPRMLANLWRCLLSRCNWLIGWLRKSARCTRRGFLPSRRLPCCNCATCFGDADDHYSKGIKTKNPLSKDSGFFGGAWRIRTAVDGFADR